VLPASHEPEVRGFAPGAVALVTGAAGGIGTATARAYAAAGLDLVLVDVHPGVTEVAGTLGAEFPKATISAQVADVGDEEAVRALGETVRSTHGRLDHLALVAGTLQQAAPVQDLPLAEWERVLRVNLTAPFLLSREFVPALRQAPAGTVVAVSSWWGRSGHALFSSYCTSKAALIVFTQSLAAELAPAVRANTVCPGNIDTPMHRDALETEARERGVPFEELRAAEWDKIPMKIAGAPATIADAVLWLSSTASSYVTGASLDVNGGVVFH
jgi:NAD(P)-dependent dehydrogenase (short-subunit alcohol dehydrogenase family)